jgi:hypothetical protein
MYGAEHDRLNAELGRLSETLCTIPMAFHIQFQYRIIFGSLPI